MSVLVLRSGAEAARALAAEGAAEGGWRRASLDRCDQPIPTPARPNSAARAAGNSPKSLPNSLPPVGARDSRRQARLREDAGGSAPPGVPPPGGPAADGARGDARVRHEIRRVRVVREEDDEDETRSLLPQAQSPFLDGSGPSTSPFPPLPLQPVRTGQRTGALRHRS